MCEGTTKASQAGPPAAMSTIVLVIPPEKIALFKAVIESYDNLATLRTEDPRRHQLKLYFAPESAAEVNALIDSLAADFALRRLD
jgi:Domain of unknown function (DUF4911)